MADLIHSYLDRFLFGTDASAPKDQSGYLKVSISTEPNLLRNNKNQALRNADITETGALLSAPISLSGQPTFRAAAYILSKSRGEAETSGSDVRESNSLREVSAALVFAAPELSPRIAASTTSTSRCKT